VKGKQREEFGGCRRGESQHGLLECGVGGSNSRKVFPPNYVWLKPRVAARVMRLSHNPASQAQRLATEYKRQSLSTGSGDYTACTARVLGRDAFLKSQGCGFDDGSSAAASSRFSSQVGQG